MTKEIFKQVKNFCCREIGRKEWEQMTTANKTLLLACRRYFNWAGAATLRQENHVNDPRCINYYNYPIACKPTVDSMINWWKASGLSQVQHLQQQQQRRQHVQQQQPQYMYHQQQPQYMHHQQQPQQPQPIPTPTRSTNKINAYKDVVRAINNVANLKSLYKDTIKSAFRVLSGTISTEIDLVCNTIFSIGKKTFPTDASSAASSSTGIRLDIAQILAKVVSDETCLKLICDDLEMLL